MSLEGQAAEQFMGFGRGLMEPELLWGGPGGSGGGSGGVWGGPGGGPGGKPASMSKLKRRKCEEGPLGNLFPGG